MNLLPQDLGSILTRVSLDMRNKGLWQEMNQAGYSDTLHWRLRQIVEKGADVEPHRLQQILLPLRTFYVSQYKSCADAITTLEAENTSLTAKVSFLSASNTQIDSFQEPNNRKIQTHKSEQLGYTNVLANMDRILANPVYQQRDPGYNAAGMDM